MTQTWQRHKPPCLLVIHPCFSPVRGTQEPSQGAARGGGGVAGGELGGAGGGGGHRGAAGGELGGAAGGGLRGAVADGSLGGAVGWMWGSCTVEHGCVVICRE